MKRTMILVLVAVGAVVAVAAAATAAPPSVTISVSRPSVVYGGSVTLSGKLGDRAAGQTVTVLAEPSGTSSFAALGGVTTSSGGRWSDTVKPAIETSYQASWMSSTSSSVTVKVRPLITLTLVNPAQGRLSVKVTADRSFARKFVLVQRLTSTGVGTVKKVTLDATSSATFAVRLHRGRSRLRVVMPTSQTAPGYIAGTSNVVTVNR
jgi:hypothetical protein